MIDTEGTSSRAVFRLLLASAALAAALLTATTPAAAQELEPRRWSHLPTGYNVASLNYARTDGDINIDPVLGIADATMKLDTVLLAYVHSFALLGKSARIEVRQPWHDGTWSGIVNGVPTSVRRKGLGDTTLRVAVNLLGAPPLSGREFGAWRAAHKSETILGAALVVQLPTGEYFKDKLINLGNNRFTIRPQIGFQHRRGAWTFESTAMAWMYTENSSYFNGNRLVQAPFYTLDGTVIYTSRSGLWGSLAAGIGKGGGTTVNGRTNGDDREDIAWAVSAGVPLTRDVGVRIGYTNADRQRFVGNESKTFSVGVSASWR